MLRLASTSHPQFIPYHTMCIPYMVFTYIIYGIHIQLIMPNTIENESKNRVQINKMAIEEKT